MVPVKFQAMKNVKIHVLMMTLMIALIGCEKDDDTSPSTSSTPTNTEEPTFPDKKLLLKLVNDYRTVGCTCGTDVQPAVDPVVWNDTLELAAEIHSMDMNDNSFFSHTGSDGSSPGNRVTRVNYNWRTVGENIARGQVSEEKVIEAWINSPGHCKNIMNPSFKEMGVSELNLYWTQIFARK